MTIKEMENRFKETAKMKGFKYIPFKEFYKYFKHHAYYLDIKTIVDMYRIASR